MASERFTSTCKAVDPVRVAPSYPLTSKCQSMADARYAHKSRGLTSGISKEHAPLHSGLDYARG
ncbi:hypothetical protein N7492_005338 [Penicillium capsulatum]|uniref:Uncharacterized protein n=1 Tax=Penicillium capsulatum TaxID=69766 RepID=A0A9W9IC26_9EURO|nr:hypothetical protein N7492_005338 [Penicillium capsulatum]